MKGFSKNKGHGHPVLIFLVLAIIGIIGGVYYLKTQRATVEVYQDPGTVYERTMQPNFDQPAPMRPQPVRLFVVSFISVLGVGLVGCMLFLFYVDRHNRRVRREVGIPWATNGHGSKAMYSEMNFQQTVLQINAKLTQLEDKAHQMETLLMQRAVQGDWNI